jgi:hypothetical protein
MELKMKPKRKLYRDCLKLSQTSESIGYCAYYGKTISFCPNNCPYNYYSDIQEKGDIKT